jgi:hypothetical protein
MAHCRAKLSVKIAFRLSAAPRPLLLLLSPKEAVYLGSKGNGMVQAENIDSGIPNFQLDNRFGRDHHSLAHLSKFTLSEAGQACRASRVFLIHYGAPPSVPQRWAPVCMVTTITRQLRDICRDPRNIPRHASNFICWGLV